MKKIWKDYFSFNSRERIAIIFLCCLIAFFWLLPNWYPNKNAFAETPARPWKNNPIDSEKILATEPLKKLAVEKPVIPIKYFEFDPNELEEAGWKKLGIHEKTIQTILHYRAKGGRFRKPEDLRKIWGMLPADADRLVSYCVIPESAYPTKTYPVKVKKLLAKPILINQATAAELETLPGINKGLAGRMIKFRDKLGGFQNLDQVRRTYGLTDSVYQLIVPLIVLQE